MHKTVLGLALAGLSTVTAANPPSQVELNGFLLGQYQIATDSVFGKPTQVKATEHHWSYRVYVFDKVHNGYMVFRLPDEDERTAFAIQIAGAPGTRMRPFLGLVLGDDKARVLQVLGKPEKIEPHRPYDVDMYRYKDRNYSVEINRQGKLSSIQILSYEGFAQQPTSLLPDIRSFRNYVVNHDADHLLAVLAGDLEVFRGDQIYAFEKSARAELENPHSKLHQQLFADKNSLQAAFRTEKFEPETQLRMYTKAAPGVVVKFPHSRIVQEVVYKF